MYFKCHCNNFNNIEHYFNNNTNEMIYLNKNVACDKFINFKNNRCNFYFKDNFNNGCLNKTCNFKHVKDNELPNYNISLKLIKNHMLVNGNIGWTFCNNKSSIYELFSINIKSDTNYELQSRITEINKKIKDNLVSLLWIKKKSRNLNKIYYVNKKTNKTQWDPPI